MKIKHISLLIGIAFLFHACEVQIEDDRRILVKGNIIDSSNNPLANVSVRSGVEGTILGEAFSDENGQFQFTSLEADGNYALDIIVNLSSNDNNWKGSYNIEHIENPEYSAKRYFYNLTKRKESGYDLGQIILRNPARLTLFINNIPGDNNTLKYQLEYMPTICEIDLKSNNFESCWFNSDEYRHLDEDYSNIQVEVDSQLGSSVTFNYILNNEPMQSISIPLSNSENTYVFEY